MGGFKIGSFFLGKSRFGIIKGNNRFCTHIKLNLYAKIRNEIATQLPANTTNAEDYDRFLSEVKYAIVCLK
jgi:hypothetical protein